MKFAIPAVAAAALCLAAGEAAALTIDFEGETFRNVNPAEPFVTGGYTFMPANAEAATFAAGPTQIIGDTTAFLGFQENNPITLTASGGAAFDLASLLIGPSTIGAGLTDFSITGALAGGGSVSANYTGLTTATFASLNWTGLSSVTFVSTDDAGVDDLVLGGVSSVPLPASGALLMAGLAGVAALRRKRAGA